MAVHRYRPERIPGAVPYGLGVPVRVRTLWRGGALTSACAVVAGVAAFGVAQRVFDVRLLGVAVYYGIVEPSVVVYALACGLAAVVGTALMHMLLRGSPRPFAYFRWIVSLSTVLAVLLPLFAGAGSIAGPVTAAANAGVGAVVWIGVAAAARLAVRTRR